MSPKQCIGLYQIKSYIVAVNAQSPAWKQTDYAEIVTMYELMFAKQQSSVLQVQPCCHSVLGTNVRFNIGNS